MTFQNILAFIYILLYIEIWQILMKWYILDWLAVLEAGFCSLERYYGHILSLGLQIATNFG